MSHILIQAASIVSNLGLWYQRLMVAMELGHVRLLCRWKLMSPVGPNSQEMTRLRGPSRWHSGHTREPIASLADVCCYWNNALGEKGKHSGTFSPGPAISQC